MLRRPPTRIELKVEDIEEWEEQQKDKRSEPENYSSLSKKEKERQIQSVETRIGLAQQQRREILNQN